jgi:hypothetical protein
MPEPSSLYRRLFGTHHLESLLCRLGLHEAARQQLFGQLVQQCLRHAVWFGLAVHPDVDGDHLELVWDEVMIQLADAARAGRPGEVQDYAVRQLLTALTVSRGLPASPLDQEVVTLVDLAATRLGAVLTDRRLPLVEMFAYNRSLGRHYSARPADFAELIDWTTSTLEAARAGVAPAGIGRLLERLESLPAVVDQDLVQDEVQLVRPQAGLRPAATERQATVGRIEAFPPIPTEVRRCPQRLAEHAAAVELDPPARSFHLYQALLTDLESSGVLRFDASQVGQQKELPPLIESALLVHLLGLEPPGAEPLLGKAADRLLVHHFIPAAREVGAAQNRHEPLSGYLVSVLARALRPWPFDAPPLTTDERIVIMLTLSELATAKARKLLCAEKKHRSKHQEGEVIGHAADLALARLPDRITGLSPKLRIDRVSSALRYLNRVRRGEDPRTRDRLVVASLMERGVSNGRPQ